MGERHRCPARSESPRRVGRWAARTFAALLATLPAATGAAEDEPLAADFADMTLEQLSNVTVTSVSRRTERLADAAASIYVITAEDIRRSGAANLGEVLRLAPVLQVARADANQYAITARGFNSVLANKLLVMIDGRTIYSPLFSGVFWEAHDLMLGDIDRIEVISGPGGTMWGTNAVNGVIHVITKSAADTKGTVGGVLVGNEMLVASARYGTALGASGNYRVYARVRHQDDTELADGRPVRDESDRAQAGFRGDWSGRASTFTLISDGYFSHIEQALGHREVAGFHVLGRWNRSDESGSGRVFQIYYDFTRRRQPGAIRDALHTYDVEYTHAFAPFAGHRAQWGAGARYQPDHVVNLDPRAFAFLPPDRKLGTFFAFLQDDLALVPGLDLGLGVKLEHNEYTGLEYLPTARLAWRPAPERLVWAAASRSVRAPSRIDREFFTPGEPPFVIAGGPDFVSEVARVAEIGYRAQPSVALSYSLTGYWHDYDHLRTLEPYPGGARVENRADAELRGVEAWASWRAGTYCRLSAGAVRQDLEVRLDPDSRDLTAGASVGNDPDYWWKGRASFDLARKIELDLLVRRVGALPFGPVPHYTALDARLAWASRFGFSMAIVGRNLSDNRHPEWGAPARRAELDRTVDVRLAWRMP